MKKYFPGLIAVVCALAFSAFTKPFTLLSFKLKTNPIDANIVNNPEEWTTSNITGQYFGVCSGSTPDLACKILIDMSKSSYFHTIDGGEIILNSLTYANTQNPKQDYLEIKETPGLTLDDGELDRKILSIQPKHYNTETQQYEDADLTVNLSYKNAQEIDKK
jgi:hypothetical protein